MRDLTSCASEYLRSVSYLAIWLVSSKRASEPTLANSHHSTDFEVIEE